MTYTLPSQQSQKAAQDAATLAALGFSSEQVEALRGLLGVPPRANMKMPEAFDINNPPNPQPPPGGWPKIPCLLHRLNAKTGQNESKMFRTQREKDQALESGGWHLQPQAVIEVDAEPELSQEELIEIHRINKEARKKKQAKGAVMVEDGAA